MKLPVISSEKALKVLAKFGFKKVRQKGSHISLHKKENNKTLLVIVPVKKILKKGTLLSIIKQSRITRDKFLKRLK
ncbi:MAG: type II toxin-antitoxin system HicA family toxin [Nanoarchaeota archaeon]|nr:type II toxin-antitoxin system HicA family toxin [Nanoarchaeota archaeon]